MIGTKEGGKSIYMFVKRRERKTRDLDKVKCVKDEDGKVFVQEKDINTDQYVEPNVGTSSTTSGRPCVPLTEPPPITVNVYVLDKNMNDILDGNYFTYDTSSDEETQIKRTKVQRKKSVVVD